MSLTLVLGQEIQCFLGRALGLNWGPGIDQNFRQVSENITLRSRLNGARGCNALLEGVNGFNRIAAVE